MNKRTLLTLITGVLLVTMGSAVQADAAGANVRITVYNQNFGLVKDLRTIDLKAGENTVIIDDVAALIQPATVHFVSLTAPDAVGILEQNYQYDLLDPQSVINKSVGKRAVVRSKDSVVEGTIMNPVSWDTSGSSGARAANPMNLVIRTDSGIVLNASGQIELKEIPEGLISKPRLLWKLESSKAGSHKSEISYMTQGLNWSADYVAVVSAGDDSLDLQGWVTLVNNSGASFRNASLQLVAGDVRRVSDRGRGDDVMYMEAMPMAAKAGSQFQEEKLFDYHLYTLQRPADVLDRETKQISLLEGSGIKAEKKYFYDGLKTQWWWRSPGWRPGEGYDTSDYNKVNVTLEFKNTKENKLGMPLPKGVIRVYKKDKSGNLQFVGEDSIDHTPRDESIKLYVGDAFDIVGERKRTDFKRISDRVVEEKFQITLRNQGDTPATIIVVEHVTADWEVLTSSHKFDKQDARTINFPVTVAPSGKATVTYHLRTRF